MSALPALIEKLSALQGPSYAVEEDIAKALGEPWDTLQPPPNWTASLDAAITLTERCGEDPTELVPDTIEWLLATGYRRDEPIAPQVARAVCLVLLRALQAKETTPEQADG